MSDVFAGNSWYAGDGPENDVVMSSRVRLARNLADFPFPKLFRGDDADRIQALVFDTFAHEDAENGYYMVPTAALNERGAQVLAEWGALDVPSGTGVVMQHTGATSCVVNTSDHVRIVSFVPGLSCTRAFEQCRVFDGILQERLQFAASYDFGYLTAALCDAGSGMKLSIRVHIPATVQAGKAAALISDVQKRGFSVSAPFGIGGRTGEALGSVYQISSAAAQLGTEIDQVASMHAVGLLVAETERKIRAQYAENNKTDIRNILLRAYALAKFSTFLEWRESVDIISDLKWGMDSGLIGGITDSEFSTLLFRIQDGHLSYLAHTGTFSFESDVARDRDKQVLRLRAVSVQETVDKICFQ